MVQCHEKWQTNSIICRKDIGISGCILLNDWLEYVRKIRLSDVQCAVSRDLPCNLGAEDIRLHGAWLHASQHWHSSFQCHPLNHEVDWSSSVQRPQLLLVISCYILNSHVSSLPHQALRGPMALWWPRWRHWIGFKAKYLQETMVFTMVFTIKPLGFLYFFPTSPCNDSVSFWVPFRVRALHMGVSENSVPLNPMVNDHYPY